MDLFGLVPLAGAHSPLQFPFAHALVEGVTCAQARFVNRSRSTVSVDIINLLGGDFGIIKGIFHAHISTYTVGVRSRNVISIR